MKRLVLILTAFCLCAGVATADDDTQHHEDMTPEQLGTVHFPTTCVIQVQAQFERGVALLHSFWYEEAEKQFNQIIQEDPRCAMAHWGVAMSLWHELWNHPDRKTIKKGLAEVNKAKKMHSTDDRERGYISAIDAFYGGSRRRDYHDRAVAYTRVMETNYQRHPEDREGAAFYALALLASAPDRDTTFANQRKRARSWKRFSRKSQIIRELRTTSFTVMTARSWRKWGCRRRGRMPRSPRLLPTRCTCLLTSSPA
jgi:hypothetical protein